jgi:LacI family transcriptional regulator
VDNVTHICQNVTPNLTSVMVNFSKAGENAVELLKRRIENPRSPVKTLTYGIIGVVKRASTSRPYTDRRVANAVEFITDNACSRISSKDVTDHMGCSRRMAEELFRRHTGASILQAIQAARIATAKNLLKNGSMPIDDIPSFCGYDSTAFFKTVFRRETGMSMREWRRRCDEISHQP